MMIGWANYSCLGPVSKAYSAVDQSIYTPAGGCVASHNRTDHGNGHKIYGGSLETVGPDLG